MNAIEENAAAKKDLSYYLGLSYPMELQEDDGSYTALCPDLPGCISYGDTPNEAVAGLNRVKRLWISGRLDGGMSVPEPTNVEDFSGKFLVRVPKSLHRNLVFHAQQEGVSLNQYVTHLLSAGNNTRKNDAATLATAIQTALMAMGHGFAEKNMYYAYAPKSWNIQSSHPNFDVLPLLRRARDVCDSFHYPQPNLDFSKKAYVEVSCE